MSAGATRYDTIYSATAPHETLFALNFQSIQIYQSESP